MKRWTAFLFVVSCAIGAVADGTVVDGQFSWKYEIDPGSSEARILEFDLLNAGVGSGGALDVRIPELITEGDVAHAVTYVGPAAFRLCPTNVCVRVPAGIYVDAGAFVHVDVQSLTDGFQPLREVVFEGASDSINLYAFVSDETGLAVADARFPSVVKVVRNGFDSIPKFWRGDTEEGEDYESLAAALTNDCKSVLPVFLNAVAFEANGGSAVAAQSVKDGAKASRPTDPTKEGCLFEGWFTDAALTEEYDFGATIAGDLTLYAKWAPAEPEPVEWYPDVSPVTVDASETQVDISLPLPDGAGTLTGRAEAFEVSSLLGEKVFFGMSQGYQGVTNVVVVKDANGGMHVDVRDFENNRAYTIYVSPDGTTRAWQFVPNPSDQKVTDKIKIPEGYVDGGAESRSPRAAARSLRAPVSAPVYVDVMVAYDQGARSWTESRGSTLDGFAALAIERMNAVLVNSGLASKFLYRLVGVHELQVDCGAEFDAALDNVEKSTTEAWKALRDRREALGADVVTILANVPLDGDGVVMTGLGWSMEQNSPSYCSWFSQYAYNICSIQAVSQNFTMLHEIGHNMGAGHGDALHMGAANCGPQVGSDSCGHYFQVEGKTFFTVMGYNYDQFGDGYSEAPFFSTPNCTYKGVAVGDARHNNVAALEATYQLVASNRGTKEPIADETVYTVTFIDPKNVFPAAQQVNGGQRLDTPTPEAPPPPGVEFVGWFLDAAYTTRYDFSQPVTSDLTLHGKWIPAGLPPDPDPDPDPEPSQPPALFAAPATTPFMGDATYNGWVRDGGAIVGLLTVKSAKPAKPEKGGQSKLTIQYTPFGGKKTTIRLDALAMPRTNEVAEVLIPGIGTVRFGANSLAGVGFDLQAGKDLAKSKDKTEKNAAKAALATRNGAWSFALATSNGYAAFSVTVKKGKGKLTGTLPDGTKVSVGSQGILGEGALAIPFMYAKKGALGLVFWMYDDGTVEVSDVTTVKVASGRELAANLVEPSASLRLTDGAHTFTTPIFSQEFQVAGKKWNFPKSQKKLGDADPNPYGTKLTFADKTGLVKGSFTIVGQLGKVRYTVNGVVVDGVMYGSAVQKGADGVECRGF